MSAPDFLIHNAKDTVGVVVVEDVSINKTITGWVMEHDKTIELVAKDDIPLGHKIALDDIKPNDIILKYGHDIGKSIASISCGSHVHVHNVKTKRW